VPALNCLSVCGLRDGIAAIGQFCIDTRLALALKGDIMKGLFFYTRAAAVDRRYMGAICFHDHLKWWKSGGAHVNWVMHPCRTTYTAWQPTQPSGLTYIKS